MTDIEPLHQFAYDHGADPIEYAVALTATQIEAVDAIRTARVHDASAYAVFKGSLADDATARRVIAALLDAGWTPPSIAREG